MRTQSLYQLRSEFRGRLGLPRSRPSDDTSNLNSPIYTPKLSQSSWEQPKGGTNGLTLGFHSPTALAKTKWKLSINTRFFPEKTLSQDTDQLSHRVPALFEAASYCERGLSYRSVSPKRKTRLFRQGSSNFKANDSNLEFEPYARSIGHEKWRSNRPSPLHI